MEHPITLQIFDIPEIHKYINENADNILEALACTNEIRLFDCQTIRSLVELKYPLIRKHTIQKLFIPYIFFLLGFLYYSTFLFEQIRDNAVDTADSHWYCYP